MVSVLGELTKYVPACDTTNVFKLPDGGEYEVDGVVYHSVTGWRSSDSCSISCCYKSQ